jgi:hypothetical protein
VKLDRRTVWVLVAWAVFLVGVRLWGLHVVATRERNLRLRAIPLYGHWDWSITWWLLIPVAVGALVIVVLPQLSRHRPWRVVLVATAAAGVAFSLALAVAEPHRHPAELLQALREGPRELDVRDLPGLLNGSAFRSGPAAACARVYGRLYEAVAEVAGAQVIVDSSKSPTHGALVAQLPAVDVAFLHLVRDPRATAHSWTRGKPAPGQNPREEMWRMPAWRAARAWLLSNAIADRVRRRRRSLLMRYEDVMADPRRSLDTITSLVGQPAQAEVPLEGRWVELPTSHTASGNPDRFRTGPVELRDDDAWRTDQRPLDRLTVTVMTLPLLHRFGYPVAASRRGREGARA